MELPSGQCSVRWGQRQPAVTSSAPKRLRRLTTYRLTVTFAAAVLALAAALVSPLSAAAQEARGTITGTVRDAQRRRHARRDGHHHQHGDGHEVRS